MAGVSPGRVRGEALTREQRGWCWYDWANSVFQTSVLTVFLALHLTDVVTAAARATGQPCPTALRECTVPVFGVPVQAGSVFGFLLAGSTVIQLAVLPVAGAIADRTGHKRAMLGGFAFLGAAATCGLAMLDGTAWGLGAALFALANLCYYGSVVAYYAFLVDIAPPEARDRVSSRGWAFGFLGGGVCLALNIAMLRGLGALGVSQSDGVRVCFVVCGLWWAGFTLLPLMRLTDRPGTASERTGASPLTAGFRQLGRTLAEARRLPITLAYLGGFLIFIDGINTVAETAGLYGSRELGLPVDVILGTVLVVQFLAFAGALAHGWLAGRIGARRAILVSLLAWVVVISAAYFVQPGQRLQFYALAAGIGVVLGGTAALSRSLFSQLVPAGREAQYFALYTIGERGTAWLGPLVFTLVANATGSFRPAIVSLVVFLVAGFAIVAVVPVRRGIRAAGNPEPPLV